MRSYIGCFQNTVVVSSREQVHIRANSTPQAFTHLHKVYYQQYLLGLFPQSCISCTMFSRGVCTHISGVAAMNVVSKTSTPSLPQETRSDLQKSLCIRVTKRDRATTCRRMSNHPFNEIKQIPQSCAPPETASHVNGAASSVHSSLQEGLL
jgi:hypothetical protein